MQAKGGTEILYDRLAASVDLTGINLIKSVASKAMIDPSKINVLWEHLNYDQPNVQGLKDESLVNQLDAIVFVSHWQHDQFRRHFPIPGNKCYVIQNATEACPHHVKPSSNLRLIYTSTPWRGLKFLIQAWKKLNRQDVELVVYSGTKIYGQEFHEREHPKFVPLYQQLQDLPGVTYYDYAPNSEIRKALESAHILAYPSSFEETSCLAAIEALAAGCKVVTTSFGALPETCGVYADYIPASANMVDRYVDALNRAIDTYWEDETQFKLLDQVSHYNQYWTWDYRIKEWDAFFKEIRNGRKMDSKSDQEAWIAA